MARPNQRQSVVSGNSLAVAASRDDQRSKDDSGGTTKQESSHSWVYKFLRLEKEEKPKEGPTEMLLSPAIRRGILIAASAVAYVVLLVFGVYRAWSEPVDWCSGVWLLVSSSSILAAFEVVYAITHYTLLFEDAVPKPSPIVQKTVWSFVLLAVTLALLYDAQGSMIRINSLGGVAVIIALSTCCSTDWSKIDWLLVSRGLLVQYAIAFVFLRWETGKSLLSCTAVLVANFLGFAAEGSNYLFTYLSAGVNLTVLLNNSDSEPSIDYARIQPVFAFQTQTCQMVSPYIPMMTKAELHSVLTSGYSNISSTLFATLVPLGISADHLLIACLMSVPSSLICSKLFFPETERTLPYTSLDMGEGTEKTILEAGVCGTRVALRVLGNIVALVVSFMGCIKTCDLLVAGITDSIGLGSITLEKLIGYLMTPLALAMGVCLADSLEFGRLVGVKIVSNECIAFIMLQQGRKALEKRTVALATFALCGLGNLCSVGTALGTIGALCPQRLATVAQMSFRAMWAGCTATLLNACVVGSLID